MMRQTLCQYGNCTLETSFVCVTFNTNPGERSYFCSATHGALYLLGHEGHHLLAKEVEHTLNKRSKALEQGNG